MRLSVITPTFNSAVTIERTIQSVLQQNHPDLQYIIIDGGSSDETLDIVRRFGEKISKLISEPDEGIADAFNKGINLADGELIGIINSDDEYEPDAFRHVVQAYQKRLAENLPPAILHGNMIRQHGERVQLIRPRQWGGRDGLGVSIHFDMPINHPTSFVPRDIYEQVGQFDTTCQYCMDMDFVIRAFNAKTPFEHIPQTLARFHVGGASTSNTLATLKEVYRVQRYNGLNPLACGFSFYGKWVVNRLKAMAGVS